MILIPITEDKIDGFICYDPKNYRMGGKYFYFKASTSYYSLINSLQPISLFFIIKIAFSKVSTCFPNSQR